MLSGFETSREGHIQVKHTFWSNYCSGDFLLQSNCWVCSFLLMLCQTSWCGWQIALFQLFATPRAWHGIVNRAQVPPVGLTCSIRLTSQPAPICSLSVVHMECEHVGNNSPQLSHECVWVKWVPLLAFSAWYTCLLSLNVPVLPILNRCLIVSFSETLNNY